MAAFVPGVQPHPLSLPVGSGDPPRQLVVPQAAGQLALFSFAELLEAPLAAVDYIALCVNTHRSLILKTCGSQ